jgi:hypothetical protein
MGTNWKSPKTTIGSVAKGKNYYHRKEIVNNIWSELKKGNSILIAAPRRVGKTSIMQYMEANPIRNYRAIFDDIEGIDSEKQFYGRLYRLLLSCLSLSKGEKAKKWFLEYIKSKSITELDIKGKIKIEKLSIDYLDELNRLLEEINKKEEIENIVLLIDELPGVLFNINKTNNKEAVSILKNLRRWRQNKANRKIQFVFAGSVGIHYVVNAIENRNSDLNDLALIQCDPLSPDEFYVYIKWATEQASIQYSAELQQYLAEKIQYFVPYFINLMLDEIDKKARKNNNPDITKQVIDEAFDTIIKNNEHFSDWKNRLKDYLLKNDFIYVNELLTHIAHKEEISLPEIYDKAIKHGKTDDYMDFINDLEKDGYITEFKQKYVFVSPFLKAFWKRNNPVYNG